MKELGLPPTQAPDFSQAPDGNAWRVHIGQQIAAIL